MGLPMTTKFAVGFLVALFFLPVIPSIHFVGSALAQGRPKIPKGSFGCSAAVRKFDRWSKGFEHAAIAVGRARTITGIKGCNYVWNRKSRKIAERDALRGCKKNRFRRGKCEIAKSN